jgi:surface protein
MDNMFYYNPLFNQNIGNWDVSNVTDMSNMFYWATSFNNSGSTSISGWTTSACTDMSGMFQGNQSLITFHSFNQPIGSWDVSNVTDMSFMFNYSIFNQNIGNWDVSNVTDMSFMFQNTLGFDQNLSGWSISNVTDMNTMFGGSSLSTTNYNNLLIGWSGISRQPNVNFGVQGLSYTISTAGAARATIVSTPWTVFGDTGV